MDSKSDVVVAEDKKGWFPKKKLVKPEPKHEVPKEPDQMIKEILDSPNEDTPTKAEESGENHEIDIADELMKVAQYLAGLSEIMKPKETPEQKRIRELEEELKKAKGLKA